MIKRSIFTAGAAILYLGLAPCAQAHEVQPMIVNVTPSGSAASYRLMVRNTDAKPITLEISPLRVLVDDTGTSQRTPELADIVLFPPQTLVNPGQEQAIQVRYVGDPTIKEGRVYAILVSQLPIDFTTVGNGDSSTTKIKVGFDFVSHMVVQPASAVPNLSITNIHHQPNGDLVFDVLNSGDGVALLRNAQWVLKSSPGQPLTLPADSVSFGKFGAILPGGKRVMTIAAPLISGLTNDVTVAINLN